MRVGWSHDSSIVLLFYYYGEVLKWTPGGVFVMRIVSTEFMVVTLLCFM